MLGRRLDYAFLSPGLEKSLVYAEHLHDVRIDGLSDHSALSLEISDKNTIGKELTDNGKC